MQLWLLLTYVGSPTAQHWKPFLESLGPIHQIGHFTFRFNRSASQATRAFEYFVLSQLSRRTLGHVAVWYFFDDQPHRYPETTHLHALVSYGGEIVPCCDVRRLWTGSQHGSNAVVDQYDPGRFGIVYAANHADWSVYCACPRRRRACKRGRCPFASASQWHRLTSGA